MKTKVTKADLKEQLGTPCPRPVLYCTKCGSTYSANRSDYFLLPEEHTFRCCRRNMRLARPVTRMEEVA